MILSDIRDYLKQRGQCTLSDIALHFDTDADAVRGMLDVWIRKGKVEKRLATAACGSSCQSCDPATTEVYVWLEGGDTARGDIDISPPDYCGKH
ncbi:MAG TPA: sugar metabolism transcriptional regulator [Gammaproteobacteria bacterium]|nr:sugar metabolism transcriptional regulator [Gammaproteobacteria bacterium]